MSVFSAGATGILGRRLVPRLVEAGHEVVGTTRTPTLAERLRELGQPRVRIDPVRRNVQHAFLDIFDAKINPERESPNSVPKDARSHFRQELVTLDSAIRDALPRAAMAPPSTSPPTPGSRPSPCTPASAPPRG